MKIPNTIVCIFFLLLIQACATYKTQINNQNLSLKDSIKELDHTFYLVGNVYGSKSQVIIDLKKELSKASKNSTVLFLGDNVSTSGSLDNQLQMQTEAVKDFNGRVVFIPGNDDWQYNGLEGLKKQEIFIESVLGNNTFLPKNGCPIELVEVSKAINVIVVDSEWYLANWDKHSTINDHCEILTREKFLEKLQFYIKESKGKTTLIAMHHPIFSDGEYGGQYDFMSGMKPFPVVGVFNNILRKTAGLSTQDMQNKKYNALKQRIVSMAQDNENVVFVSGHEQNLQCIVKDNLVQIISGSGSKSTATRNINGHFTSSDLGFAKLEVFKDGSSRVQFYSSNKGDIIYETQVFSENKLDQNIEFEPFTSEKIVSVYPEEKSKSIFYEYVWGERYRKYYQTQLTVSAVKLDTLFGGLKPISKDLKSRTLQLSDKQGRLYVMKAIKKSPTAYLEKVTQKKQRLDGQFDGTETEHLFSDFNTGAHPYAPFVIGSLSKAANLYHTNPMLYFVPKQKALERFNQDFGDELYLLEEQVSDTHKNLESFGKAKKIISTYDVMEKLLRDENYTIDTDMYIRARLFDMLIGDWNKHADKWRWAEFEKDGKIVYLPIPEDRDLAFSMFGDGLIMNLASMFMTQFNPMEGFNYSLRDVKGFNANSFYLDIMLLNKTTQKQWENQAILLQNSLTEDVIKEALKGFPKEVQDEMMVEIRLVLKGRLNKLLDVANKYYKVINKTPLVIGTDGADWFDIERLPKGKTKIAIYNIENGEKGALIYEKLYSKRQTKELWIYGLSESDVFKVYGKGTNLIDIALFGGPYEDVYRIENGLKVKMYDFESEKNEFATEQGKAILTDDYETNMYDHTKIKYAVNDFTPDIGANPDAGLKIGFINTYTKYGVERNPFSSQHTISSFYYFATQGLDFEYNNEFANIDDNWNFGFNAKFTSPSFAVNFFGYGNSTQNLNVDDRKNYKLDYNRVKLSTVKFTPTLNWKSELEAKFKLGLSFESVEVEKTADRFISDFYASNGLNNKNTFVGLDANFSYANQDNEAFPTLGMQASLQLGSKSNFKESRTFSYLIPEFGLTYKLIPSGQLVFVTRAKGHVIIGDGFEFYQSANLGENNGLRGYRNERFSGENVFCQSSDIRINLRKIKTRIIPLNIGVYGGYDYGRVWVENSLVLNNNPSFNANLWNTALGGGVFANAADILMVNVSLFHGSDGVRLAFSSSFQF